MLQLMLISRISGTPLAVKVNEIYKEFNQGDIMADQGLRDVTASINFFCFHFNGKPFTCARRPRVMGCGEGGCQANYWQ